jgi:hypothetical protein
MARPRRHRTPVQTRYRTARNTPLASSKQRLELIKIVAEAEHVVLSTRIAGLILLLYGTLVSKISELTLDDITTTPARTTIQVGDQPAPIPEALLPLFHQHLVQRGNHRTMNHHSPWLFPGTRAGQHISEQVLMQRLRGLGVDIACRLPQTHAGTDARDRDMTPETGICCATTRPA